MGHRLHIFAVCMGMLIPGLLITPHAAANGAEQEWCPVMPDERIDAQYFTDYQGQRVYFCCARCLGRFERNPDAFTENLARYVPGFAVESPAVHEHDHAAHDHGERSHLLTWLGKHHPFVVHFPIAFLLAAAGVELVRRGRDNAFLRDATRFCVWTGGIGAVVAGLLGWLFGGFRLVDETSLMTWHRWIGTAVVVSGIPLMILAERYFRAGGRGVHSGFHATLTISAGLTALAGFLGGSLIYGLDHLLW